ncbi:oligopeptide/dipeptide ABC transporter ATP-binding protein [Angulomicrobium tetraedrale]|uniref:Oligopeptide/dipeptide ABC transporter ATP-binding protein n=1 Tax=Ancylobacter tetraedralis TaxID=217068 RepID=A0A839Z7A1_9HYPH|nr:oligopeptide/dipeptide ABC transporter ATP-binding protein [Ancylobacter tetraedralis]MBB3770028.1 oligopeptide/dipeptide ABC transporter ATP-binding protein [Ancylobacter tetraedralis]
MLEIQGLDVDYRSHGGTVRAVRGVDLAVGRGETLGLVGESGCGKSSLARAVMRLTDVARGAIRIDGIDIARLKGRALLPYRRKLQMVFQDSASSLDPRFDMTRIIEEPLRTTQANGAARARRVASLMDQVGLAASLKDRYPHELSGGQRQRAAIARALACGPELLVLDEPVSALDVSLQAQVLNLLVDLQQEYKLAYLFVSHDIGVVQHMADRVAVMYLGRIVETGTHADVLAAPAHPYTQALLAAVPVISPRTHRIANRPVVTGELPSPLNPPTGCAFHPRCPLVQARCRHAVPQLRVAGEGRAVACHLHETSQVSSLCLQEGLVPA